MPERRSEICLTKQNVFEKSTDLSSKLIVSVLGNRQKGVKNLK